MPAAHFVKPLKNRTGHEVLISPTSFPSYSAGRAHRTSLLAITSGIMASARSHYLVTEGGVTLLSPRTWREELREQAFLSRLRYLR